MTYLSSKETNVDILPLTELQTLFGFHHFHTNLLFLCTGKMVTISHLFFFFFSFITLTVWRSTGQAFCRMTLHLGLSATFSWLAYDLGENATKVDCFSCDIMWCSCDIWGMSPGIHLVGCPLYGPISGLSVPQLRHVWKFSALITMNKACINILIQVFVWTQIFLSLE